jgi:hypothetical protein
MDNFKDMLSTRNKNGLSRCFGSQVLDQPEIIINRLYLSKLATLFDCDKDRCDEATQIDFDPTGLSCK